MKPVIGRKLTGRKVVSTSGLHLGDVLDAYFEDGGVLVSLLVKPEKETRELDSYLNSDHLLEVPFESVQAVGRYVIADFPTMEKRRK